MALTCCGWVGLVGGEEVVAFVGDGFLGWLLVDAIDVIGCVGTVVGGEGGEGAGLENPKLEVGEDKGVSEVGDVGEPVDGELGDGGGIESSLLSRSKSSLRAVGMLRSPTRGCTRCGMGVCFLCLGGLLRGTESLLYCHSGSSNFGFFSFFFLFFLWCDLCSLAAELTELCELCSDSASESSGSAPMEATFSAISCLRVLLIRLRRPTGRLPRRYSTVGGGGGSGIFVSSISSLTFLGLLPVNLERLESQLWE